jgi:ribonuclease HI
VAADGATVLREESGLVLPEEVRLERITNNLTELLAAVRALEAMPDGWAGVLYTDSQITLFRVERRPGTAKRAGMAGIPPDLIARRDHVHNRLGPYQVALLGGHPTREELAAGKRREGMPCSPHNVACDEACGRHSRSFLRSRSPQ